jgi:hypothetical protein
MQGENNMIKIIRLMYYCALIVILAQFSSNDTSVTAKVKPSVNFYGTITDDSNNTYTVENITISGLYKQIPVYSIPPKNAMNPERNVSRIDLAEVSEIKVPHYDGIAKSHIFANRHYVEIEIVQNDQQRTSNTYIIEKSRKIRFDKVTGAGLLESELSLEALDKIIIKGFKAQELEIPCPKS